MLAGDLEFTSVDHFAGIIGKMIDIHTTVEIRDGEICFFIHVLCLGYFFTEHVKHRNGKTLLVTFLNIKRDIRSGGVGIQFEHLHGSSIW